MATTNRCPNCSAPISADPSRPTLRCDYCKVEVNNPAYRPPGSGAAPTRSHVPLIVGAVLGLGAIVGVVIFVVAKGTDERASASRSAPAETPEKPVSKPKPAGPRVQRVLGTMDLTGDKVGDLAFAGYGVSKPDGTKPCYVGLLDGTNGKTAWHREFLGHNRIRVLGAECHGLIVVQDNTRSVIAYEGKNGAQRWRLTLSDFIGTAGIWPGGTAAQPVCLFATVDKQVAVVDAKSGKLLWRKETRTPWGRHGIKVSDSIALLPRQRIAVELLTGEEHELPLVGLDRRPVSIMGSFAAAGEHFYYRPSKKTEISVYDVHSWKRVARIAGPAKLRAHLYPVGRYVMPVTSISEPAAHIALIDGARMVGSVQLPDEEVISQIRSREDVIVVLTVTTKGTKSTTVRVYDQELKQLWEAQLDDSGRSFQLVGYGPNFGGTSGGGRVIVAGKMMLIEMGPDAEHRAVISSRNLHTGEVLGEVKLPGRTRWKGHASLRLFRSGERRAFAKYSFGGDEVVAIDPAQRKVVWTYGAD